MDVAGRARSELEQAQIICVIGGPGVGKGTQCAKMVKDLGVVHLSIGEALRSRASTNQGVDITAYMRDGKLVPTELVQGVLEAEIRTNVKAGRTRILLDGFPRSIAQTEMFEDSHCKVKAVLYFEGSRETLISRMLNRAQTSGRVDDTEAIFDKRYQGFLNESREVIRYFEQEKKLVKVDCDRPLEDIYGETMEIVKSIFSEEREDGNGFGLHHDKNPKT
ncbi:adenylate kinase-domain-containing protein [Usnea florida]